MFKKNLGILASVLGLLATVIGITEMIDRVRLVDILTLFVGGVGFGAGLVKTIIDFKKNRFSENKN